MAELLVKDVVSMMDKADDVQARIAEVRKPKPKAASTSSNISAGALDAIRQMMMRPDGMIDVQRFEQMRDLERAQRQDLEQRMMNMQNAPSPFSQLGGGIW